MEAAEQSVHTEQETSLEPNIAMEEVVYHSKGKKEEKEISKGKQKMSKQDLQHEREEDINREELDAYI